MTKLVVAAVAAALAGVATAAPSATPSLRLVSVTPQLVVRGVHFHARERVRVRVTVVREGTRHAVATRTSASGAFTVGLGPLTGFDPCNDVFNVIAVGGPGERASVKYVGRDCPPAP